MDAFWRSAFEASARAPASNPERPALPGPSGSGTAPSGDRVLTAGTRESPVVVVRAVEPAGAVECVLGQATPRGGAGQGSAPPPSSESASVVSVTRDSVSEVARSHRSRRSRERSRSRDRRRHRSPSRSSRDRSRSRERWGSDRGDRDSSRTGRDSSRRRSRSRSSDRDRDGRDALESGGYLGMFASLPLPPTTASLRGNGSGRRGEKREGEIGEVPLLPPAPR